MDKTTNKIKIYKLEKTPFPNVYGIRVESHKYLDNPIITYVPTPKIGDAWYADIFIEERK
jgi:hypothetical protein